MKERFNPNADNLHSGGVPDLNAYPEAPHFMPEGLVAGGAAPYGYGIEFSVPDLSSPDTVAGADTRSVLKPKEDEADPQVHPL